MYLARSGSSRASDKFPRQTNMSTTRWWPARLGIRETSRPSVYRKFRVRGPHRGLRWGRRFELVASGRRKSDRPICRLSLTCGGCLGGGSSRICPGFLPLTGAKYSRDKPIRHYKCISRRFFIRFIVFNRGLWKSTGSNDTVVGPRRFGCRPEASKDQGRVVTGRKIASFSS